MPPLHPQLPERGQCHCPPVRRPAPCRVRVCLNIVPIHRPCCTHVGPPSTVPAPVPDARDPADALDTANAQSSADPGPGQTATGPAPVAPTTDHAPALTASEHPGTPSLPPAAAPEGEVARSDSEVHIPAVEDLFRAGTPSFPCIPQRVRTAVTNQVASLLSAAAAASGDSEADVLAYRRLYLFVSTLTFRPPGRLPRGTTARGLVRDRLRLLNEERYDELWEPVILYRRRHSAPTTSPTSPPGTVVSAVQQRRNAARAVRLAHRGAYAKAAQALTSTGVAPRSPDVRTKLIALHPRPVAPLQPPTAPATLPTAFEAEEVRRAALSFRRATAAGVSGLAPDHLVDLLGCPAADAVDRIVHALTRIVNVLYAGRAPRPVRPWQVRVLYRLQNPTTKFGPLPLKTFVAASSAI